MDWLRSLLNAADPTVSLRHTAYAAVIASGIVWLSVDLGMKQGVNKRGIDGPWVSAFGILVGAVTIAKGMKGPETKDGGQ